MNFIFMLTHNDSTVPDAGRIYDGLRAVDLHYIGFKDVGGTLDELALITEKAHADGREVLLEVVSTSRDDEVASIQSAKKIGVDWVLGGTHVTDGIAILRETQIKYCPFPGRIVGHPSVLEGSITEIAESAREITTLQGVFGVDLLAYRHQQEDPVDLTRQVVRASSAPVIVAGSIVSESQIKSVAAAGAWGYTIGGAIFEGRLPGGPGIAEQVSAVLETTAKLSVADNQLDVGVQRPSIAT